MFTEDQSSRSPKIFLNIPSGATLYPTPEMSRNTKKPRTILTLTTRDILPAFIIATAHPSQKEKMLALSANQNTLFITGSIINYRWGSSQPIEQGNTDNIKRSPRLEPASQPSFFFIPLSKKDLIPPDFQEQLKLAIPNQPLSEDSSIYATLTEEHYLLTAEDYILYYKDAQHSLNKSFPLAPDERRNNEKEIKKILKEQTAPYETALTLLRTTRPQTLGWKTYTL